jgi:hypothetical protein
MRAYSICARTNGTSWYNPGFSMFRRVPRLKGGPWTSWNKRCAPRSMFKLSDSQRTDLEQVNAAYLLWCPNLSELSAQKNKMGVEHE